MEQSKVDGIISQYVKKIYGFSLSKTNSLDMAEELAASIVFEVYKSLLNADEIYNIDGYIYRVANNVLARFLREEKYSIEDCEFLSDDPPLEEKSEDNVFDAIRQEIAFLGKTQREVVVLHYFQKKKLKEIASLLNLPFGTVAWHLHDARKQIKDGFASPTTMTSGEHHSKQDRFGGMYYLGPLGQQKIEMPLYFASPLSQWIALSAYHQPKTTIEIAKEISVPVAFVEDEITRLCENHFVEALPSDRFQTNIYITEQKKEKDTQLRKSLHNCAKTICDTYFPLLKKSLHNGNDKIYTPRNDQNFLLWTMFSYAASKKFDVVAKDLQRFRIKRIEGGVNIATAQVNQQSIFREIYMDRLHKDIQPETVWVCLSDIDVRTSQNLAWSNFDMYTRLYAFMTGKIKKDIANIDTFIRLFDNGYVVSKDDSEYVNAIVTTYTEDGLAALLPPVPKEIKTIAKEIDNLIYQYDKDEHPIHLRDLCKTMSQNSLTSKEMRTLYFEYMLDCGMLKPLKQYQKQTVNMIMFCDVLPTTKSCSANHTNVSATLRVGTRT